jgi:hypothetical protein
MSYSLNVFYASILLIPDAEYHLRTTLQPPIDIFVIIRPSDIPKWNWFPIPNKHPKITLGASRGLE